MNTNNRQDGNYWAMIEDYLGVHKRIRYEKQLANAIEYRRQVRENERERTKRKAVQRLLERVKDESARVAV